MSFFFYFLITFLLSLSLTWLVKILMQSLGLVDQPGEIARKIHSQSKPVGGGIAVFVSFFSLTVAAYFLGSIGETISFNYLLALFFGGAVLMIGGLLDDIYNFSYFYQFIFPLISALIIVLFGIGPEVLTNPFGEVFDLAEISLSVVDLNGWIWLSDLIVFVWLTGMMFTTKLLDGLDGLVAGIVAIGALMIFFLSIHTRWYQPEMSVVSIIFAGACLGFLVWNWHPAKIFLGESGSLFCGFLLGSLAILSGGKIATTLLVMGIPVLDIIRVVIMRAKKDKSVFVGDNEHLHFRLIQSGLSQRQAVLLFYAISFSFGITTLFLQSSQKLVTLSFLGVLMLLIGVWFSKKDNNE
jgi:UDP-GlcNAc:undecaprenyl-phosphate GlcNAc-1-phosphate transferase